VCDTLIILTLEASERAAAQHGVPVRPLRARDRGFFDAFLCSALAAIAICNLRPLHFTFNGEEFYAPKAVGCMGGLAGRYQAQR
jgi:hypothetical protein